MTTSYTTIDSPIGRLLLTAEDGALTRLSLQNGPRPFALDPSWRPDAEPLTDTIQQLREYFAAERRTFDLPLAARGNEFQLRVWNALTEIPYGQTASYGAVARRIGAPSAARAVGLANGQNPISVIVPCHRVIGSDGSLTGYGGGLPRKRHLLDLEAGQLPLTAGPSHLRRTTP